MLSQLFKIVSLIYYMVSEINILTKFRLTICHIFMIDCTRFEKMHCFFDKYAIKNNLQNKMQITHFLMASKNIDFDHVCHVSVYR